MQKIQIAIEGPDAVEATQALMDIPALSGEWQMPEGDRKDGGLTTIALIVGIAGGTITAAEQIRKWWQEWKKGKSGKTVEKAVLVCKAKRVLLEGASVDEIKALLDELN